MGWIDALGYFGALITLATYSMKTMIPLRIAGICANVVFIVYGLLSQIYPSLFLHVILLPLNSYRLYQMRQLVEKVKVASRGDLNMDWLKPFMTKRLVKAGEALFQMGDVSSDMFYTVTGRYRLPEIGSESGPGQLIGEIGLIAPGNKRTLSFECLEDGEVLAISYSQVKQLYYQNPKFGFYFLQLISQRLFQDIELLKEKISKTAQSSSSFEVAR